MPWSGYPETSVTQLTYTEWLFSLAAHREVQIGYSIRVQGTWELFGDDRWVWFTGKVPATRGAIQIVSQWVEVEPQGSRHRVWHWIHWRNPSGEDTVVRPYFLLAPPVHPGYLSQAEQTTARRRIWTIADVATSRISALGTSITVDTGDAGGGEGGRGGSEQGLQPVVAVRPLDGQQRGELDLAGDLRYLPVEELWRRIDEIVKGLGGAASST